MVIAILYKIRENPLETKEDANNEILFVVVNQTTGFVYSGKLPRFGISQRPDLKHPIANDPSRYAKGYVNPDLVHVCGVPIANATYTVYATLGEYKSNVLTVKTVVK